MTDTEMHDCLRICYKPNAIILEPTPTRESTNREEHSFIWIGYTPIDRNPELNSGSTACLTIFDFPNKSDEFCSNLSRDPRNEFHRRKLSREQFLLRCLQTPLNL